MERNPKIISFEKQIQKDRFESQMTEYMVFFIFLSSKKVNDASKRKDVAHYSTTDVF